jgi:ankyrin repeat protein
MFYKKIFFSLLLITISPVFIVAMDVPLLTNYEKTIDPEEQDKLNKELFYACRDLYFTSNTAPKIVKELLAKKAQVNCVNENGLTPLGVAALNVLSDSIPLLQSLLDHNANIEGGILTPLMMASSRGNNTACKLLLDHGAQIENPNNPNIGPTALYLAIRKGRSSTCKLLLDYGAQIDSRDSAKETVLTFALRNYPATLHTLIPCALFNPYPQPFSNLKEFIKNGSLDPETTVAKIKAHHIECIQPLMLETMLLAKNKKTLDLLNPARLEQNFGDTIEQVIRERLEIANP